MTTKKHNNLVRIVRATVELDGDGVTSAVFVVDEIDGSLESMQAIVGGYIEHRSLHLFDPTTESTRAFDLWCNEEGALNGLPEVNTPWGPVFGNFFLSRLDAEGNTSALSYHDVDLIGAHLHAHASLMPGIEILDSADFTTPKARA